jgi:hypothetical protein
MKEKIIFKPATADQIARRPKPPNPPKCTSCCFEGVQLPTIACLLPSLVRDHVRVEEPVPGGDALQYRCGQVYYIRVVKPGTLRYFWQKIDLWWAKINGKIWYVLRGGKNKCLHQY